MTALLPPALAGQARQPAALAEEPGAQLNPAVVAAVAVAPRFF